MYDLPHHKASDIKDVVAFMQHHPFITLVGCDALRVPVATHVPVLIEERDEKIYLQAHIMRKQKHTIAFEQNPNVLAIFTGEHSYVSASWYTKKNIGSTWNYQAVHAAGVMHFKDETFLRNLLAKLTAHFEEADSPSLVRYMDEGYVEQMMKAIAGFEIEVTNLHHVFKLSQDRDEKSYENIVHQLTNGSEDAKAIAAIMKENQHHVFKQ